MSSTAFGDPRYDPGLYLLPDEQALLLTALISNTPDMGAANPYSAAASKSSNPGSLRTKSNSQQKPSAIAAVFNNHDVVYGSTQQQAPPSATLTDLNFDESPFLDYDLDDGTYDWENGGEQMIGSLPGTSVDDEEAEQHEKRKNPDDDDEDEDGGGGKRREGEDRTGKKPGRKLLTSEPTSKRKAQNRAAQRAFRERKERHLKELETKVDDLEKASESANHENGLLRAQVDRLQTELKEFRKKMSSNGNGLSRSPPQPNSHSLSSKSNWDINSNFQFEFPTFGPTPTAHTNGLVRSSTGIIRGTFLTSASPTSFAGQGPMSSYPNNGLTSKGIDDLSDFFSPSILSTSRSNSSDHVSYPKTKTTNDPNTVADAGKTKNGIPADLRKGSSDYITASPAASASSVSQQDVNSSCGTTPESSAESPALRKSSEIESADDFCKQFSTACGNIANPIPGTLSGSDREPPSAFVPKTPNTDFSGIDWFASQNGGAFDPILFGDYRDPQENIMSGDMGAFFNDAFPIPDLASPSLTILEPSLPHKHSLLHHIKVSRSGNVVERVPADGPKQFLTCNMLWDRVQKSERVQSGEADMDDLCAQLKSKAKCSGSGAVIDEKDVDAILGPAPKEQAGFMQMFR